MHPSTRASYRFRSSDSFREYILILPDIIIIMDSVGALPFVVGSRTMTQQARDLQHGNGPKVGWTHNPVNFLLWALKPILSDRKTNRTLPQQLLSSFVVEDTPENVISPRTAAAATYSVSSPGIEWNTDACISQSPGIGLDSAERTRRASRRDRSLRNSLQSAIHACICCRDRTRKCYLDLNRQRQR